MSVSLRFFAAQKLVLPASVGLWDCDITTGLVIGDARWHHMRGVNQSAEQAVPFDQCAGSGDGPRIYAELRRHARAPATKFDLVTTVPGAFEGKRWIGRAIEI